MGCNNLYSSVMNFFNVVISTFFMKESYCWNVIQFKECYFHRHKEQMQTSRLYGLALRIAKIAQLILTDLE